MEKSDIPFADVSEMVARSFEQTRKAMEKYLNFFKESMTTSQWFGASDLNKKMQNYTEQNIAAASDFSKKLTQAKDFGEFWRIQTEFMQAQGTAFSEQMKDLSDTATKSAMGSFKELSPNLGDERGQAAAV